MSSHALASADSVRRPLANIDRSRTLALITELRDQGNKHYCLAAAIRDQLKPDEYGSSSDLIAFHLAELLMEMLAGEEMIIEIEEMIQPAPDHH